MTFGSFSLLPLVASILTLSVISSSTDTSRGFHELNDLVKDAVVRLPDASVSSGTISLDLEQILCSNFSITDITITNNNNNNQDSNEVQVQLQLLGLDLRCVMDYTYSFLFTRRGSADVEGSSQASILATFTRPNIHENNNNIFRPASVTVNSCNPTVSLDRVEFQGDISAVVLDTVKGMLRRRVEAEAELRICQELDKLTTTHAKQMFATMQETLSAYPPNTNIDPTHSESTLQVPAAVRLMDFHDPESTLAHWFRFLVDKAVEFVSLRVDETGIITKEQGGDWNINYLIRKHLLDKDHALTLKGLDVELYQAHDTLSESALVLSSCRVFGLDTLSKVEPVLYVGNQTISTTFSWEYVQVEVDIDVLVKPSTLEDSVLVNPNKQRIIRETVKVTSGIRDLTASVSVLLAVDETRLESLPMGGMLQAASLKSSLSQAVLAAEVSALTVYMTDIEPPRLNGLVASGIDRIVSKSVDAFFLIYEEVLRQSAPSFFQITVRKEINKMFHDLFLTSDSAAPIFPVGWGVSADGFVDFRSLLFPKNTTDEIGIDSYGDLLPLAASSFRDRFMSEDEDGSPAINSFIRTLGVWKTTTPPHTVSSIFLGTLLEKIADLRLAGLRARLTVKLDEVLLENLDSFHFPLKVLEAVPNDAHVLENVASMGGDDPIALSARLLMALSDGESLALTNELQLQLSISSLYLALNILLLIQEERLLSLPFRDALIPSCWIANVILPTIEQNGVDFSNHELSVEDFRFNVSCVSCSSPNFDDMVSFLYNPSQASTSPRDVITYARGLAESDFVKIPLKRFFSEAARKRSCSGMPQSDETHEGIPGDPTDGDEYIDTSSRDRKAFYFSVINIVTLVCLLLALFVLKWNVKRQCRRWRQSLPANDLRCLEEIEDGEEKLRKKQDDVSQSMFSSPNIPHYLRLFVPGALVVNMGLFLGGHLGLLSTVNVNGQVAGEVFEINEFLSVSFVSATARTYNNGGQELAVLAWIFVAVWPYIKLTTSLVLWFLPPKVLSLSRRGSILLALDVLAKISIVDVFIMAVAVAALLVFVGGRDQALTTDGVFFSMKMTVVPGGGFYCIIIAQQISKAMSRSLLACHAGEVARAEQRTKGTFLAEDNNDDARQDETVDSEAAPLSRRNKQKEQGLYISISELAGVTRVTRASLKRNSLVGCMASLRGMTCTHDLLASVLIVGSVAVVALIGCLLAPSVSLDTRSVWALLGEKATFEQAAREYSVFKIVSLVLLELRFVLRKSRDYFGLGLLLLLLVVLSCIPLLVNILSLVLRARQRHEHSVPPKRSWWKRLCCVPMAAFFTSTRNRIVQKVCSLLRLKKENKTINHAKSLTKEASLLPAFRMNALKYVEIYILAFVIASWQLGAVTAYAIHMYCFLLEQLYSLLVYLGLRRITYTQCFRVQASATGTFVVVVTVFVTLLGVFSIQAISRYNSMMSRSKKQLEERRDVADCSKDPVGRCDSGETQLTDSFDSISVW